MNLRFWILSRIGELITGSTKMTKVFGTDFHAQDGLAGFLATDGILTT